MRRFACAASAASDAPHLNAVSGSGLLASEHEMQ